MALGLIDQTVLADIANAIREQNGTDATYKPSEMAAAVLALDGTNAGAGTTATFPSKAGVVNESVFTAIADAIRSQNGTYTTYKPSEMGDAIRALEWDTGLKPRAVLLDNGMLEFNYLDGRQATMGSAAIKIVSAWEVSTDGYSSQDARPWHEIRDQVTNVWIDSSFARLTFADVSYWLADMGSLLEVGGFGNLVGVTKLNQCFSGDSELRSIWGAGFDSSAVTSCSLAFYGCRKLVGGHLTVAKDTFGKSYLTTGTSGLLTDSSDDEREWAYGYLYSDGSLVVTKTGSADSSKEVTASGTLCTNACYNGIGAMPWHGLRDTITSVTYASDMADVSGLCMDYWFYNVKSAGIAWSGWSNVHPVSWEFFLNGSLYLTTLDLRGLDASTILRWSYALSGMSALTTIYVDSDWTLPGSFTSKSSTFYSDKNLVGGNGTAFDSSKTSAEYAVIDTDDTPGYLTAG